MPTYPAKVKGESVDAFEEVGIIQIVPEFGDLCLQLENVVTLHLLETFVPFFSSEVSHLFGVHFVGQD